MRRGGAGGCEESVLGSVVSIPLTHLLTRSLTPSLHLLTLSVCLSVFVSLSVCLSPSLSLSLPPPPIQLPTVTNELSSHPMSLELARCDQSRGEHKMRWGLSKSRYLPPSCHSHILLSHICTVGTVLELNKGCVGVLPLRAWKLAWGWGGVGGGGL